MSNPNRDFIKRGSVGQADYGYVKQEGKRNVWSAVCPLGGVYEAPENNLNSAAALARSLAAPSCDSCNGDASIDCHDCEQHQEGQS